jgi:uncharacterized protein YjbJ (UPF0337 family)
LTLRLQPVPISFTEGAGKKFHGCLQDGPLENRAACGKLSAPTTENREGKAPHATSDIEAGVGKAGDPLVRVVLRIHINERFLIFRQIIHGMD